MSANQKIPAHIQEQMKKIGSVLRWLRKNQKMTLNDFKEKTNLSVGAIRNVENGEDAKISTVLQVCDQLGFNLPEFLEGSELVSLHEEQKMVTQRSEFEQDWGGLFSDESLKRIATYKEEVEQFQDAYKKQISCGEVVPIDFREYSASGVPATIEELQARILRPVRGNNARSSVVRKKDSFEAEWQISLFQKKVKYTVSLVMTNYETDLGTPACFIRFELLKDKSDALLVDLSGFWCIEMDAQGLKANILLSTCPILFAPASYRARAAVAIFGFLYPLSSQNFFKRFVQKAHANSYM